MDSQVTINRKSLDFFDGSGDTDTTPLDVLLILNHLASHSKITVSDSDRVRFDVSGDDVVAQNDALLVIKHLTQEENRLGKPTRLSVAGSKRGQSILSKSLIGLN
ncbi:dockerin type I domain-containing protein [Stieleria sp. JC731]|uniref:dockerin type I domain-containing protein n=1 Tax=Pirellulaceae TaxID=2691357 RepID=UPI00396582BB